MTQLLIFIVLTAVGYGMGYFTGINPTTAVWFDPFTAFALTLGLYNSVVGIDLGAVRDHKLTAAIVVTVAVPVQIIVTGLIMYLIYPQPVSWLIAVAITQIDPLSVDTLLRGKESMSDQAKGLLRIWASFDDPVTVLFGFLILFPIVTGQSASSAGFDGLSLFLYIVLNTVPALVVWLAQRYTSLLRNRWVATAVLVALLALAFFTRSYLLAALLGLILRPLPENFLSRTAVLLYYSILIIVGMGLFAHHADLASGIRLGALLAIVAYFVIQPVSTIVVFNGRVNDVFRIAYAQQNGLTTLLMGTAFQALGIDVLYILLPAIILVNFFNLAINKIYTYKEARGLIW